MQILDSLDQRAAVLSPITIHVTPEPAEADIEALFLIRGFERLLLDLFSQGVLNGTTHTCLGQEYIPVALSTLFEASDFIFSNHRGHGHYLARFGDAEGLLLEIMGREGGVCNGVGGSQHLFREGFLSTGVLGESVPAAAGMAWSLKRRRSRGIAVAYTGDGSWGEGSVYETLNIASLWQLPLLVVVENNAVAQSSYAEQYRAGTIGDRARAFGVRALSIDSCNLDEIRNCLAPEIAALRTRPPRPLVVEFLTRRLGPHSKSDDPRPPELIAELWRRDWEVPLRQRYPAQCERVSACVGARLEALRTAALQKPLSEWTHAR
ncbi:MAG: thiamine pyrophosphate-dependent dehydrogenase E1 component subunit alpha [Candidatus Competibacter denitrificans]|jgi:TPP-dependent pyruvate/acetoin dehydrogenase alpha subunit